MGSYNYLGFAENEGKCLESAVQSIKEYGISNGSRRAEHDAPTHSCVEANEC